MYVLSSTLAHLLRKIIASDAAGEVRASAASLVTVRRRGAATAYGAASPLATVSTSAAMANRFMTWHLSLDRHIMKESYERMQGRAIISGGGMPVNGWQEAAAPS